MYVFVLKSIDFNCVSLFLIGWVPGRGLDVVVSCGTGNCHSDEEDVVTTAIFDALKRTSSKLWICIFFESIPKIEKFSKFLDPADFCNFGNF